MIWICSARSRAACSTSARVDVMFGCQLRQPVDLILGPAVFNRHVLAFDVASVFKALAECAQTILDQRVRRSDVEEPDHRHRRLLRARRERPRSRAADERDELAPSHCRGPPVLPAERIPHLSYGRRLLRCGISIPAMTANGMVRPCSGPASKGSWEGAPKTRSTPCHTSSILRLP